MEDVFRDNFRQTRIITKYESRKYLEGKKILLYGALMALVLGMLIVLPYVFGDGLSTDPDALASYFMSAVPFMILLSATLFASGAIVSEFEDRTGLFLFTKPIKKWSIYIGKGTAACLLGFAFVAIYYVVVAAVSFIVTGSLTSEFLVSFMLALLYTFATTGVAVMLSSMVKKSSTAAILTFVMLLMIFTIISTVLSMNSIETWFMLDEASTAMADCITNPSFDSMRSGAVMLVWGAITGVLGFLIFRKREF